MSQLNEIDLSRTFSRMPESGGLPDGWDRLLMASPNGVGWEKLLELPCSVVLGEAGTGKTTELRQQTKRLVQAGCFAFLADISSVALVGLVASLEGKSAESLASWKAGTTQAWLFLDSVDEARLRDPKALENALRRAQAELGDSCSRCRFVISCRVSDWRPDSDINILRRFFNKSGEKKDSFQIVQLTPLNPTQVKQLAELCRVDNPDALWHALSEEHATDLAERPRDVIWIANYWKQNGKLGQLHELIEHNVKEKLDEKNDTHTQFNPISPEQARAGAETLAAAAVLCKQPFFCVPDPEAAPSDGMNPHEALPGWSKPELKALLNCAVFDEATYGRVRFHHRTTAEFLAASWFVRQHHAGAPITRIAGYFIKNSHQGKVAVPSLRGVAGWVADGLAPIREEMIRHAPELLFYGDPKQIPVEERARALRELARRYPTQDDLRWSPEDTDLKRIADPGLAKDINELIKKCPMDSELRRLLIRIARLGNLTQCAPAILDIAINPKEHERSRGWSIDALRVIGSDAQKIALATAAKKENNLSSTLVGKLCAALFPKALTLSDCFQMARNLGSQLWDEPSFMYALAEEMTEACPKSELPELLENTFELLMQAPAKQEGILETRYSEQATCRIFERIIVEFLPAELPMGQLESVCAELQRRTDANHGRRHSTEMESLKNTLNLSQHKSTRDSLLRLRLKELRSKNHEYLPVMYTDWEILVTANDLDWFIEEAKATQDLQEREWLLRMSLRFWSDRAQHRAEMPQVICKAAQDPQLEQKLQGMLTHKPSPEAIAWHLEEQQRKAEKKREEEEAEANFRQQLVDNLDSIRAGTNFELLYSLWIRLAMTHNRRTLSTVTDWKTLSALFGDVVAEAAHQGFTRFWRTYQPELPHTTPGLTYHGDEVGLTGLSIEILDGLDLRSLSSSDAETALRYALKDVSFPSWLPELVDAQPSAAQKLFTEAIQAELSLPQTKEPLGEFVFTLHNRPGFVANVCALIILAQLELKEPEALETLDYSLQVLRDATTTDTTRLAAVCHKYTPLHQGDPEPERFIKWLRAWMEIDGASAWPVLEKHVRAMPSTDAETFVESLAVSLSKWNDTRKNVCPGCYASQLPVLRKMFPFFATYIKPEQDLQHKGVHSIKSRDIAQGFRSSLVSMVMRISGEETYKTLLQFSQEPLLLKAMPRLLFLAERFAAGDTELKQLPSPTDVAQLERRFEKEPANNRELFERVLDRLEDVRFKVEEGDFSPRSLFGPKMLEEHIQAWLAGCLRDAMFRGGSVTREEEVAGQNRPDIRVHHPRAGVVSIEIKPTDRYSFLELVAALETQLVGQYMQEARAKSGVLFLAHLKPRKWKPNTGVEICTPEGLEARLNEEAKRIARQKGLDGLRVVGVDFVAPQPAKIQASPKKTPTKRPASKKPQAKKRKP